MPKRPLKLEVLLPVGLPVICAFVGPKICTSVKEESPARLNPKNIRNSTCAGASSPDFFLLASIIGNLKVNLSLSISG